MEKTRINTRNRMVRCLDRLGLGDLFDSPVPMIPTAIGGHVINLPYGLDPGQLTDQGINILGDWLGQYTNL